MGTIDIILIIVLLCIFLISMFIYIQKITKYNNIDKKIFKTDKYKLRSELKEVIEKLGYKDSKFLVSKKTLKLLKSNYFDTNTIELLINEICRFLNIPFEGTVEVDFVKNNNKQISGQFILNKSSMKIKFFLNENYTLAQLIAIACHECTHLYLYYNEIFFDDKMKNEVFTDIAAIYLGLGKYISDGYVVNEKIKINSIEKNKVGYISSIEINYLIKEIKKMKKTFRWVCQ